MAKAAKTVGEVELTERIANKFVKDILAHFEAIESARGKFMNVARRERDQMTVIYESMAQKGISQTAAKTEIKIVRALEKVKGWMADLEAEDRKMVMKIAKATADKKQLLLFGELPPLPKPTKAEREEKMRSPPKSDLEEQAAAGEA